MTMTHEFLEPSYGLTTAKILYRIPDFQHLLNMFIYQLYDNSPEFPKLYKFLYYWKNNLDGPIYSVSIAHCSLVTDKEIIFAKMEGHIH